MIEYTNPDILTQTAGKLSDIERKFVHMRAGGATIKDIAKKLKKSTHTICDMNKKFTKHVFNIRNAQFSTFKKKSST